MAERKKRFSGLYWQQFALTAGMVMLTLLLLGVSFFALSYNYNFTERRDELQERASLIAQVSVDYLKSGGQTEDENLKRFISLGSAMTNAEFLVCNDSGYALLTADQRLGGKVVAIPQEITQEVLTGSGLYQGRSSLGGAYTSKQFVVGVPVQDGDQTIGVVLAVMNARSVMGMWRSFISLFLMTSAIILLLVFIVTSLTSMRQIQPIREMVQATRAYAAGNFDVRMQDADRGDEIGELAAGFNNMADSLAETERQRRVHRRYSGRHHPAGKRTQVPANYLRREPSAQPSGAPDAGYLSDPVAGNEKRGLRPVREYASGAAVHGAEDHRPGVGRRGGHPGGACDGGGRQRPYHPGH
mgnify:CR=1 FL=1